jgi:hypothetical protein
MKKAFVISYILFMWIMPITLTCLMSKYYEEHGYKWENLQIIFMTTLIIVCLFAGFMVLIWNINLFKKK